MSVTQHDTIVLGAGVAGLATALYLQRAGVKVTIIDPLPPAGGTSFGNAGMISADTAAPIAMPGMLRQVPRWLTDKTGPLVVRPSYFPRALPWLLRWIEAGRLSRVMAISDAMRALHRDSFACWQELLGSSLFHAMIRQTGQVQIWEGEEESASAKVERQLRERHGIRADMLGPDELRQMFPGISRNITRGLIVPGNGFTINPGRLVRTLGELFRKDGGELVAERALKLIPYERGTGYMVMTNIANRVGRRVVVATGAWSRELLDPLGLKLPLETERGYHVMLPESNVRLSAPISFKSRGFGITPMEEGLRIAGTVEIGGLKAPPDERRATILIEHARRLFPELQHGEPQIWMGHRPSTPDSLPVLGEAPGHPGLYLAFGHGHFGMTGGPPSGRLVARLITGVATEIDPTPYSIRRFGI
ncbi:MAG TPA: FAD-dependent oxidoreductase [Alphaproteobacteria bacterium]|nr:FAD-dependent oxidoreductase [Alphaproteobacteria bacterium]